MDAVAVAIAHEELAAADPAFCLSYLAHSLLFVNNLVQASERPPTTGLAVVLEVGRN